MNRERAKELLPIIQAYADGAVMQERDPDDPDEEWHDFTSHFQPAGYIYRIKPEPREFWVCHGTDDNYVLQSRCVTTDCFKVREVLE